MASEDKYLPILIDGMKDFLHIWFKLYPLDQFGVEG
jgi:hypothetical protein